VRVGLITGKQEFELREFPTPAPEPGKAVVEIASCGICGTDVHAYMHGGPYTPAICGHEWSGTVSACGADVDGVREGDRVGIGIAPACGSCALCLAGAPAQCMAALTSMLGLDPMAPPHGGFATAVAVSAARLYRLRPQISDNEAALLEPATVVTHALRRTPVRVGESVVVLGAGPIGLLALQLAQVAGGGCVVVIEPEPSRAALARSLGASEVLAPDLADLEARLRKLCGPAGPDLVLECAGVPTTIQHSVDLVRRGGRVALVGLASTPATIQPGTWLVKEVTLAASLGYTHEEFEITQELAADGRLRLAPLVTDTVGLEGLESALQRLMKPSGQVKILVDPNRD
jgi:(R,R)-butanediol dehydrogenase/meso-butanediol dehydrogenase/diacetyl reductase